MIATYTFHRGESPLLVSVPHDGRAVPDDILGRMTASAKALPDTDWHVAELYDFAAASGASLIVANYSRYVVDLNRPPDDGHLYPGQLATGLCPDRTFGGVPIYADGGAVPDDERRSRRETYWRPYHERLALTLDDLRQRHGYALLWDAHSIPSRVPSLFDGELPVLNLGSYDGRSAARKVVDAVDSVAQASAYSSVCDGRFKGGYITRHYGNPGGGIHALQLEIAQRAYMDEGSGRYDAGRATELRETIARMLHCFTEAAESFTGHSG